MTAQLNTDQDISRPSGQLTKEGSEPLGGSYVSSIETFKTLSKDRISSIIQAGEPSTVQSTKVPNTLDAMEAPSGIALASNFAKANSRQMPVLRLSPKRRPPEMFRSLRIWQGEICQIVQGGFVGRVFPLDDPENEQRTDFSMEEVSEADREYVKMGATFSWHVGRHTTEKGQRSGQSWLVFRKSPASIDDRLKKARDAAELTAADLGWGGEPVGTEGRRD